jgi:hypothetical protein
MAAIVPDFFFPDGGVRFERVDEPLAGGKGLAAVCGGDGDQDRRFAHRDSTQAMQQDQPLDGPALAGLAREFAKLPGGHRFVSFVIESDEIAPGIVLLGASDAEKHGDATGFVVCRLRDGSSDVDRTGKKFDAVGEHGGNGMRRGGCYEE